MIKVPQWHHCWSWRTSWVFEVWIEIKAKTWNVCFSSPLILSIWASTLTTISSSDRVAEKLKCHSREIGGRWRPPWGGGKGSARLNKLAADKYKQFKPKRCKCGPTLWPCRAPQRLYWRTPTKTVRLWREITWNICKRCRRFSRQSWSKWEKLFKKSNRRGEAEVLAGDFISWYLNKGFKWNRRVGEFQPGTCRLCGGDEDAALLIRGNL